MITQEQLLAELQQLLLQKAAKQAELQQLEGAEQMCRHLLGKVSQETRSE